MIDEETIMSFSHFFKDVRQLEKDYLLNLILKIISINKISNNLVFKGGTALYMLCGLDRFSEDLDFTYIKRDDKDISIHIDSLIEQVIHDFSLNYKISKNKGNILIRDENGKVTSIRTELFIEGPLFKKIGARHKIKIDISTRDDIILKPEAEKFLSKYNDIGIILIYMMQTQEILAEKFCALIERTQARDLYDAYFLLKYKNMNYDEDMIINKLKKRKETFDRKLLLQRIEKINEKIWKEELSYIVSSLPKLNEIKAFVKNNIANNSKK
jgi:hypothetical protein